MAVFVRVVELGGFAAAAKEAEMSPAMAAKHVVALESRLGARLLHRSTRRRSLTEVGHLYFDHCKRLLAAVDAAESSVSELRAAPRGTLRMTAPVSFGTQRLAPALKDFLLEHPDVNVELMLSDRVVDLIEEGFEVAIRIGRLADSQLVARPLRPYRSLLCASPEYIRRRGRPRLPQDLPAHDCLDFSFAGPRGQWRMSRGGEEQIVRFSPRLRANNGDALRQAALAGLGILMQPEVLIGHDVAAGRLTRLLPAWSPPERPMHLVYLRDRQATPKLQAFVGFMLREFGPGRAVS
jgi:DNA-binding transcriptional LysR family regulator